MAEVLCARGLAVTLVTPAPVVSNRTHDTLEQGRIQKWRIEMGVPVLPLHAVVARDAGTVTLECVHTERQQQIACGTLVMVMVTMRQPVDGLLHATRAGDCLAPGTIAAAAYSGHRHARELGWPPMTGVPFHRELPALATA